MTGAATIGGGTPVAVPRWSIAIVGAGAIGSVLGYRLAKARHRVTLVARGAQLEAIRRDGLGFDDGASVDRVRPALLADASALLADASPPDPQHLVLLAVKARDIGAALDAARPLIGADTMLVPAVNGLPWWYFLKADGPHAGTPIRALDPDGSLLARTDPDRLVGAVVHLGASLVAPGVVRQAGDNRLTIGELDGSASPRVAQLAACLSEAGVPTHVHAAIRDEVWTKLVGNLSTNPLSVVTGATLDRLYREPPLLAIVEAMMHETMAVGAAYSVRFGVDPAARIEVGRRLGAFRTSMLQDFARGRPLELDAIVDAVIELGERFRIPMPMTRTIRDLARAAEASAAAARPAGATKERT